MSSEKEFKDTLKEKLNSKEFSFDEANWEQARQMIDASREGKKRRPFPFLLFGGGLVLLSLIGFYIFKDTQAANKNTIAVKEAQPGKLNETVAQENVVQLPVKENLMAEKRATNSIAETTTPETKNNTPNAIKNVNTPSAKHIKHGSRKNKNNTTKNEAPVNINAVAAIPVKKEKKINSKNNTPSINNTEEPATVIAKNANETPVKNQAGVSIPQNNSVEVTPVNTPTVAELIRTRPDSIKKETPVLAATELPKKDSLPKEPVNFVSFEAGTNYLFGWHNPGKRDANGFNPVVGLNYAHVFAKRTTFSFGIQYTMVRNLSYSNYVVTTTRYNFGEESDVMVFTPSTMHYLVAPVRISYAPDAKNSFGVACNVGYLINVNSNVEFYNQHAGQKGNSTVLKTSGYTQGFKTFDTQLAVFYRRNLAKDLWLHTEFMYGLSDVKDNTFFKSDVHERNVGLKVTLIYNLFKK